MQLPSLVIGRQSVGFVERGHPWVRRDRFTGDTSGFAPGTAVTLTDERGRRIASALVDPDADICARVYHQRPDRGFDPAAALARAWDRRAQLHEDPHTNCYRIVHAEADFLPGLRIERYGNCCVLLIQAACIQSHLPAIHAALIERIPDLVLVERDHLDDLRRRETRSRIICGTVPPDGVIMARELGVTVPVAPFDDLATGIYVDQRATRGWLRERCAQARVLNLFSYTGLFSISLLHAGAARAEDVDIAAPALAVAEQMASLNHLADRHQTHQAHARDWLQSANTDYDIILIDPPTAAQGAGGWVARRDYPELLELATARLAPGGILVAVTNTIGKRFDLLGHCDAAGIGLAADAPPLGDDIPQKKGFPESRPHRVVVRRAPR